MWRTTSHLHPPTFRLLNPATAETHVSPTYAAGTSNGVPHSFAFLLACLLACLLVCLFACMIAFLPVRLRPPHQPSSTPPTMLARRPIGGRGVPAKSPLVQTGPAARTSGELPVGQTDWNGGLRGCTIIGFGHCANPAPCHGGMSRERANVQIDRARRPQV